MTALLAPPDLAHRQLDPGPLSSLEAFVCILIDRLCETHARPAATDVDALEALSHSNVAIISRYGATVRCLAGVVNDPYARATLQRVAETVARQR
jgi:hypothetical protein